MNIRTIIIKIQNLVNPPKPITNEAVLGFLRVLENAEKEEITCDELYDKLDQYVEREGDKKGDNPLPEPPSFRFGVMPTRQF